MANILSMKEEFSNIKARNFHSEKVHSLCYRMKKTHTLLLSKVISNQGLRMNPVDD